MPWVVGEAEVSFTPVLGESNLAVFQGALMFGGLDGGLNGHGSGFGTRGSKSALRANDLSNNPKHFQSLFPYFEVEKVLKSTAIDTQISVRLLLQHA